MKKLVICLSSYSPINSNLIEKYGRQELYAIALWNLAQTASTNTDICVVENTTSEEKIENEKLVDILKSQKIKYKIFINKNDLGSKNKGAGELEMCQAALNTLKEKLNEYDYIIYYTSRHIIFDIRSIEEEIDNNNFDMLIGNPAYILSNGRTLTAAPGNFNDMLFVMKSPLFIEYCSRIDLKKLIREKMNSERYLYLFTTEKSNQGANIYNLEEIPIVRYDYVMREMHLVSNNAQSYNNFNKILKIYLDFYKTFPNSLMKIDTQKTDGVIITDSRLKRYLYRIFGKLAFSTSEYKYNIEPTWNIFCEKIIKNKANIILPLDTETNLVYQNRINNLNKLIWK